MPTQSRPDTVIDTLGELVRINSVNPNYEDGVCERAIADYILKFFKDRGIETWTQEVLPSRPNVMARLAGRDPMRRIILEVHTDTFSTVGMSISPWDPEVRDGRLFGRGACDTKGGLAAMMHAVADLADQGSTPACDVVFAAVIDEEYSFRGALAVCHTLDAGPVDPQMLAGDFPPETAITADAAIIAEPTELTPVIASKGLVRWIIEVRGQAAHSSKPELGINAIEQMAHLITAIQHDTLGLSRRHHPRLGAATCNIGVIRGGVEVNSVPDRCQIEIDRRLIPGESHQAVLAHYQALVDSVVAKHRDMRALMHSPWLIDHPLDTDPEAAVVTTMLRVLREMGLDRQPTGVPFGSDASKFGAIGIPSIIFGPGSIDQAHAAIEYIDCEQVVRASELYRRFLVAFE